MAELSPKQRHAVGVLGLDEDMWNTCTWRVAEDNMSKLKQPVQRAVTALGFDKKSWVLFCAVVRFKHAGWLKRIEDAEKDASRAAGEETSGKQPKPGGGSRSKRAASMKAAPNKDVHAGADEVLQGAAVVDGAAAPPPPDAGTSHTMLYHTVPHHAIPCHTIPYPTMPFHPIPSHAIPCYAIPYHTIPYHRRRHRRRHRCRLCGSHIYAASRICGSHKYEVSRICGSHGYPVSRICGLTDRKAWCSFKPCWHWSSPQPPSPSCGLTDMRVSQI